MDKMDKIIKDIGILIGKVDDVREELVKLNGKVAKHEKRLNDGDRDKEDAAKIHDGMQPILDLYRSFGSLKVLLAGISSLFVAIGIIGAGVVWSIRRIMGM